MRFVAIPFYLIIISLIMLKEKNDVLLRPKRFSPNFSILRGLWIHLASCVITLKLLKNNILIGTGRHSYL